MIASLTKARRRTASGTPTFGGITMELENEYTDRCISSTAEQVDSAPGERRAIRFSVNVDGRLLANGRLATNAEEDESIRRANAYDEAVELLREADTLLRQYAPNDDGEAEFLGTTRAFLAKGDA